MKQSRIVLLVFMIFASYVNAISPERMCHPKHWLQSDIKTVLRLHDQGLSIREIQNELNRQSSERSKKTLRQLKEKLNQSSKRDCSHMSEQELLNDIQNKKNQGMSTRDIARAFPNVPYSTIKHYASIRSNSLQKENQDSNTLEMPVPQIIDSIKKSADKFKQTTKPQNQHFNPTIIQDIVLFTPPPASPTQASPEGPGFEINYASPIRSPIHFFSNSGEDPLLALLKEQA